MDVWGWLGVATGVGGLAAGIWALVHQSRTFVGRPSGKRGRPDEPRWYGFIFGGGRG